MALSEIYSISIKTVAPQKRFKLLELPPELLTLLESEERPSTLTLEDDSKTGQLVLQTPVGSYEMRQKNSSNPIMVLQAKGRDLSQVKDREIAGSGQTGFTIVGQCDETMELLVTRTSSIDQSKPRGKWHEKFAKTR